MVTLYIWYPAINGELQVGHTSLDIDGDEYVSFWPADGDSNSQRKKKKVAFSSSSWTYSESYDEDIKEEGRRAQQIIKIRGLNEKEMIRWWEDFHAEAQSRKFHLIGNNCSTVVAQCLYRGFKKRKGGFWDKVSDTARYYTSIAPWLNLLSDAYLWTPMQVEGFAIALKDIIEDYED
jgi:hypothetical protein